MKTGNVILAIFLFIVGGIGIIYGIALSFLGIVLTPIDGLGILAGGGLCFIISFIFIIVGIVVLITGMEKQPQTLSAQPVVIQQPVQQPSSSQQVAIQQPTTDIIKMKETSGDEYMYNRGDLIFGTIFIAMGIIIFILGLWIEPLVTNIKDTQWVILAIRIIGMICIAVGIVAIIAALIPKK